MRCFVRLVMEMSTKTEKHNEHKRNGNAGQSRRRSGGRDVFRISGQSNRGNAMKELEILHKMRDKALHRYQLAKSGKKRADEEHQFCIEELNTLNRMIKREQDNVEKS